MLTKDEFAESFSLTIRGVAKAKNLCIKYLEEDCGISPAYIKRTGKEKFCINLYMACVIADYLDEPLDKLVKLAENKVFVKNPTTGKPELDVDKYMTLKGVELNVYN